MPTKLVVVNENTLGYIHPERPQIVGIFHASILKGQTVIKDDDGWFMLKDSDEVRLATKKDFGEYGCLFSDAYNTDEYEYEPEYKVDGITSDGFPIELENLSHSEAINICKEGGMNPLTSISIMVDN